MLSWLNKQLGWKKGEGYSQWQGESICSLE